jgi:hypothetical protein
MFGPSRESRQPFVFQVADGVKPAFGEPADLPKAA